MFVWDSKYGPDDLLDFYMSFQHNLLEVKEGDLDREETEEEIWVKDQEMDKEIPKIREVEEEDQVAVIKIMEEIQEVKGKEAVEKKGHNQGRK